MTGALANQRDPNALYVITLQSRLLILSCKNIEVSLFFPPKSRVMPGPSMSKFLMIRTFASVET